MNFAWETIENSIITTGNAGEIKLGKKNFFVLQAFELKKLPYERTR